jgi:hypothetical protein
MNTIGRYNKAAAAALSQALVQVAAAFVPFPPELEQAIGIILTAVLVYLVPNRADGAVQGSALPARGELLVAHAPPAAVAAAIALSLLAAGCASALPGERVADGVLGPDCGAESRAFRASALSAGLGRAFPGLYLEAMQQSAALMAAAAAGGGPLEPAATAFQNAMLAALAPAILAAGQEGEPVWLAMLRLPPLAAELAQVRREVAAFCVAAAA